MSSGVGASGPQPARESAQGSDTGRVDTGPVAGLGESLLGWRWTPVAWATMLGLLYVLTANLNDLSLDPVANSLNAQSIAATGSPYLEHTQIELPEGWPIPFGQTTPSGHEVSVRSPGQVLWAVPFYWLLGRGTGPLATAPGSIAAAVAVAIGMGFLLAALARLVRPAAAWWTAGVIALATPVWSVAADALFTHPVTVLGLSIALWGQAARNPWGLGVGYAVAVLARPHLLVVAIIHLGWVLWRRRTAVGTWVGILAPLVAGLGVLLWWNRLLWDQWTLSTYGRAMTSLAPNAGASTQNDYLATLAALVSPSRGLLLWTPVLVVALAMLARHWRSVPVPARVLTVAALAYVVMQASVSVWSGGSGFYGYRHGIEPLILLVPLLAHVADSATQRVARALAVLAGIQFGVIALGAPGHGADYDPTQKLGAQSMTDWLPSAAWERWTSGPVTLVLGLAIAAAGAWWSWRLLRVDRLA